MTAAQFLAATGRPLATGLATQDVDLLLPGEVYGDRINAVDMRFAKVLRFGKTRTNVGLDLYNLFNANTATTYETVYDPATNGRDGCNPRLYCCRDSCGSMSSSTSDPRGMRSITASRHPPARMANAVLLRIAARLGQHPLPSTCEHDRWRSRLTGSGATHRDLWFSDLPTV